VDIVISGRGCSAFVFSQWSRFCIDCRACSGLSVGPLSWLLGVRGRLVVTAVSGSHSVLPCSRVPPFPGRTVIAATRVCYWSVVSKRE
jgi:hypothetical protein